MAVALNEIDKGMMVAKEFLRGFKEFFKLHCRHVQLFIGVNVLYRTGAKAKTGMDAVHDFFQLFRPKQVLLQQFQVRSRKLLEGFVGIIQRLGIAEVFLSQVNDRDFKKAGQFQQIADLRFGGAIFVGSNIAPVEAYAVGQLLLAHFESLSQQTEVLL